MLLVTGITGHSGRYFLQELVNNKYEGRIRCVVRNRSGTSLIDNSGLRIETVTGDLTDQDFVDKALVDVDTVLHIASIFHSLAVIKAAVTNNVKRVILVHTTGIYSQYKSASEEYKNIENTIANILKGHSPLMGLIYLRPTMIYGNVNDGNMVVFVRMIDRLRLLPIIAHGKNLLQPVNGRDLGKAYYQVLCQHDIMNGDYILSGEQPITMLEMFKLISTSLGKQTVFVSVPLGLGVFMARCLKLFSLGKVDYIERVQRMGEDRNFPHDAATEDFGYNPMRFEEGIAREVGQYLGKL
jgi:nucleoside-diphosphate-sugar epimerase